MLAVVISRTWAAAHRSHLVDQVSHETPSYCRACISLIQAAGLCLLSSKMVVACKRKLFLRLPLFSLGPVRGTRHSACGSSQHQGGSTRILRHTCQLSRALAPPAARCLPWRRVGQCRALFILGRARAGCGLLTSRTSHTCRAPIRTMYTFMCAALATSSKQCMIFVRSTSAKAHLLIPVVYLGLRL